ncbi:phospho-N-acetylmuramoyl-pentapeptide-transferase [uncultured Treponema sp.]|uniref:phospho-N-acetylmuramoyl-pentapeptide- transferase n=1 Tax=uncultured Treponema sp. TaxID=162155 RepID=UPI0025851FC1|nr:phospho-N-acetylmuramoyl-pentapeptide-transferase [uncultured Treponema sp.]
MLYYLGGILKNYWGPARLLQSYAVLIGIALYTGFFLTKIILPKFYKFLPSDRGREFTLTKETAKGKPTGSGVVFITIFVLLSFLFAPLDYLQAGILFLTWLMMLTGFLDDRSSSGWGEYLKGFLDLVIAVSAAFLSAHYLGSTSADGNLYFWLPFVSNTIKVPYWLYIIITTIMLWMSVNTTNCTDGVDGLSSSLVLIALFTMGAIFYVILGHVDISAYLLVPHLKDGASWAIITFCLAGVLMGYLWHNAFPSSVLMGDAGSRALGFYTGVCVMVSGNPFLFLATSSIIFINGGMGLLKVALKRFCHINILEKIRFPLHDHMRKNRGWSPTQVLIKFMEIQLLITVAMLGIFFKIR